MSVKRPEGFFFENPKLCLGMYIHVVEPDVATPLIVTSYRLLCNWLNMFSIENGEF